MYFVDFILTSSVLTVFTLALTLTSFFLNQRNAYVSRGQVLMCRVDAGCLIDERHLLHRRRDGCIVLRKKKQWASGLARP